jgi:hypothetical protein
MGEEGPFHLTVATNRGKRDSAQMRRDKWKGRAHPRGERP